VVYRYPSLTAQSDSRRIFSSMPFGISSKYGTADFFNKTNRYLGIDVGEYGLAYTVIEVSDDLRSFAESKTINDELIKESSVRILECGFIHSHLISKIRDQYRENQKIQRTATFSRPNTKLANIRENAINSIRNRIHHLALKYKAKPIYELQISNFETGSGRVTKIYNSVKRSDPYKDQDTEKKLRNHLWGTKKGVGAEVGARATSYTCISCGCSHYDIAWGLTNRKDFDKALFSLENLGDRYRILDNEGNALKFDSNGHDVLLHLYFVAEPSNAISKKHIEKAVRDWARAPLEKFDSVVSDTEKHKLLRGNSAFYRCPFCDSMTDADIQASFNIATLGALTVSKDKKKLEDVSKKLNEIRLTKLYKVLQSRKALNNQMEQAKFILNTANDYEKYISA
jgi:hypothetical protein